MKAIINFFKFYFYLIKRDPKRFDLVNHHPESFHILLVPIFIMVFHMITAMILLDIRFTHWLAIHILIVPGTLIAYTLVRNEAWERDRQERRKKEETKLKKQWEEFQQRIKVAKERMERERKQQQKNTNSVMQYGNIEAAYDMLDLPINADVQSIKLAFRKLSKIHHPDMPEGNEEMFIRLTHAYDKILKHKAAI